MLHSKPVKTDNVLYETVLLVPPILPPLVHTWYRKVYLPNLVTSIPHEMWRCENFA